MKILVLSTWFPYPLDQGSKIRAYHLIKALAKENEITLISFEDRPMQTQWLNEIREFCNEIIIFPKPPFLYPRIKLFLGFFTLQPSTVFAGYSKDFERLVVKTAQHIKPDIVFAFTFFTAPYALKIPGIKRIVDVDNLLALMLFENYQKSKNLLQKMRRYLAFVKFKNYEKRIYKKFDLSLVVSREDVERIKEYIPLKKEQVINVSNGVDIHNLRPDLETKQKNHLVYNGAMTYHPNFDAMVFFLHEIFPRILESIPNAQLSITGKTDHVPVEQLPLTKNVILTGYLPDIHPLVSGSQVCVVPLREGAGTRLKILEAMALGTAVVSTSKGAEGLIVEDNKHLLIADSAEEFAEATIRLLHDEKLNASLVQNALELVKNTYNWDQIGSDFSRFVNHEMGKYL